MTHQAARDSASRSASKDGWELIGEYDGLRNTDLSGGSGGHRSWAGYAHIDRTFQDGWLPCHRFEKAALDQSNDYFLAQNNGRSCSRHMLGLRYNADLRAAVMLEFNRTDDQGFGHTVDELRLQYAVSF